MAQGQETRVPIVSQVFPFRRSICIDVPHTEEDVERMPPNWWDWLLSRRGEQDMVYVMFLLYQLAALYDNELYETECRGNCEEERGNKTIILRPTSKEMPLPRVIIRIWDMEHFNRICVWLPESLTF